MTANEIKEKINELKGQLALLEAKAVTKMWDLAIVIAKDLVKKGLKKEDIQGLTKEDLLQYDSEIQELKDFGKEEDDDTLDYFKVLIEFHYTLTLRKNE